MTFDLILSFADRIGVFVFALSGAIVAVRKDMDIFGVIVMGFLPAIGGGTVRDVILDQPVFWLSDTGAIMAALAGGLAVFFFYHLIENFRPLRWADALGMALFAVAGAAKTMALGYSLPIVMIMGGMTACAGGLIRDVVANEEPLLLKTDIYATAALIGAVVYYGMIKTGTGSTAAWAAGLVSAFLIRALAIIYGLSLPRSPARK